MWKTIIKTSSFKSIKAGDIPDDAFDFMDKAIDSMDKAIDSMDKAVEKEEDEVSMDCNDGHVVIKGKLKSLTVNGGVIQL